MTKKKESKTKQITVMVECAYDSTHKFEKRIDVQEDGEKPAVSEVDAFCPFCGKMGTVNIKGKLTKDSIILKMFKAQEEKRKPHTLD